MKKKTGGLIFISLIFFCFTNFTFDAVANDADKAIEKKKAAIMKIMSQKQFKPHKLKEYGYAAEFCIGFLEDFKEQENIEHIKPIIEVDTYNDPKLQAYLKQFHQSVWAETLSQMRLCDEGDEQCGIIYYATKNFKLFKVNIDNNEKNGDEHVVYAEGYKATDIDKYKYTYGGYIILDLKKSKEDIGVSTRDPYDYEKKEPIENYNGIIKYKREYYIFELNDYAGGMLVLNKYIEKRDNMKRICLYYKEK